jgi:hypothetical protein
LRQVFVIATISLTREEILALEFMYNDNLGFYYLDFISKLEQSLGELSFCENMQSENKIGISDLSEKCSTYEEIDIDLILTKIKAKVVSTGIKVPHSFQILRNFDIY